MKQYPLVVIVTLLINSSFTAQTKTIETNTIEGIIIDEKTHEPAPYVLVYLEENKQQVITLTDVDGKFKLIIPQNNIKVKMLFETSSLGYDMIQFTIKKKKLPVRNIKLKLKESAMLLKEVY